MPKFYTPTFAAPVVSLDAARATPRDLVPHEKAMLARDGHLAAELEAARAENARLKAVQVGTRTHLVPPTKPNPGERNAAIDAMVAQLLADGAIAFDAETDQYVRPRSAVWCFNGPRPWALD